MVGSKEDGQQQQLPFLEQERFVELFILITVLMFLELLFNSMIMNNVDHTGNMY